MSDIDALYHEVIIDHGRHPRNTGVLDHATHQQEGFNPLCGDKITVYCVVENNIIKNLKFSACGCAISLASASLMSQAVLEQTVEGVQSLFYSFRDMVMGNLAVNEEQLGKLAVLRGVSAYPSRIKCALLSWYTLFNALHHQERATTE